MEELLNSLLERLLSGDPSQIIKHNKAKFDQIAVPFEKSLILFGAGPLGYRTLVGLRQEGIEPLAFSDNNPKLWGTAIDGVSALPPLEAAQRYGKNATFVVTIFNGSNVRQQLRDLNCAKVIPFPLLYWKYSDTFFPYGGISSPDPIFDQKEQVLCGLDIWDDVVSRNEYVAQLAWRTTLDYEVLPKALPAQETYFPKDIIHLGSDEFFVDCGAYDGDSSWDFMKRVENSFKNVVAIEPDPVNYHRLVQAISDLPVEIKGKIIPVQAAVGNQPGWLSFNTTGTMRSSLDVGGTSNVEVKRLDDILHGKNPTFIKMDIEGSEIEALEGARDMIQKRLPVMAICAYHQQDHLWKIPLLIKSISDGYRLYLRRHAEECWELVCYAIPPMKGD